MPTVDRRTARPLPFARSDRSVARVEAVARVSGALALLAVGAVHLRQYLGLYSAIPTIGTLFVLNFSGATVIGLALLAPIERWTVRWGRLIVAVAGLSGIALAAGSFVLLLVSEHTSLFGFMEPGYDPSAIMAARVSEIAAVVLLSLTLVARGATRHARAPITGAG